MVVSAATHGKTQKQRVSLLNLVLLLTPLISCHFIMLTHFVAQYKSV